MGFMRIGYFRALPGRGRELLRVYEAEALPVIKAAPGNAGAFILQQRDDKTSFLACTAWQTKADAENYDKSGQALAMVNTIRHLFDGPPRLVTYDSYGL